MAHQHPESVTLRDPNMVNLEESDDSGLIEDSTDSELSALMDEIQNRDDEDGFSEEVMKILDDHQNDLPEAKPSSASCDEVDSRARRRHQKCQSSIWPMVLAALLNRREMIDKLWKGSFRRLHPITDLNKTCRKRRGNFGAIKSTEGTNDARAGFRDADRPEAVDATVTKDAHSHGMGTRCKKAKTGEGSDEGQVQFVGMAILAAQTGSITRDAHAEIINTECIRAETYGNTPAAQAEAIGTGCFEGANAEGTDDPKAEDMGTTCENGVDDEITEETKFLGTEGQTDREPKGYLDERMDDQVDTKVPAGGHGHETAEIECAVCENFIDTNNLLDELEVEDCCRSLEVLRALASPAYLTADHQKDPILEAFALGHLAKLREEYDKAFSAPYRDIAKDCSKFVTDLLNECESSDEVTILLERDVPEWNGATIQKNCNEGAEGQQQDIREEQHHSEQEGGQTCVRQYARLHLALHCEQKDFAAHAKCQQVLQLEWSRGMPEFARRQSHVYPRRLIYAILMLIIMPINFLTYLVPLYPLYRFHERFVEAPVARYVNDLLSYIVFICLLVASCHFKADCRNGEIQPVEWLVLLWIVGYTARVFRRAHYCYGSKCVQSIQRFWALFYQQPSKWNRYRWILYENDWPVLEILLLLSFWTSFLLRLVAMAKLHLSPELAYSGCANLSPSRFVLIGEIFYGVGCVFAVPLLLSFMKASETLGPIQVSLKRTYHVVARFFLIFLIILMSFVLGMTYIYHGLDGNEAYVSLRQSSKTLFWGLFGHIDVDDVEIVRNTTLSHDRRYTFTVWSGYTIVCLYYLIMVIILVKMFIAMVNSTYKTTQDNADREWKFVRSQLRLGYMGWSGAIPPPFNIFSPIRMLIRRIYKRVSCRSCPTRNKHTIPRVSKEEYENLMKKLKDRYWRHKKKKERLIYDGIKSIIEIERRIRRTGKLSEEDGDTQTHSSPTGQAGL